MRVGSIDIGTNSCRLFIAEKRGQVLSPLSRWAEITRLGEDVNKTKFIKQKAAERTLETLFKYKRILDKEKVKMVKVASTSVLREARNTSYLLDRVKEKLGFEVEVLSGEEEARLSFLGVVSGYQKISEPPGLILVIDIGGGSTELALGQNSQLLKLFSLNIGSVRLTEKFIRNNPPSLTEIANLRRHIEKGTFAAVEEIKKLQANDPKSSKPKTLLAVGVAGTITTLSAINQRLKVYDWRKIHNSKLSLNDIQRILAEFLALPLAERKKIIGLDPARADVITAGTLILLEIMKALSLKELIVSEYDILNGLLLFETSS